MLIKKVINMKLKFPKVRIFQLLTSLKYISYLIAIAIIIIFSLLGVFLYKYFYQTIAQSQEIVLLKQEVAPDILDSEKVSKVIKELDLKEATSTTDIDIINPFREIKKLTPPEATIDVNASSTQN